MIDVYVRLIKRKAITIDDVPEEVRQKVKDALAVAEQCQDLNEELNKRRILFSIKH